MIEGVRYQQDHGERTVWADVCPGDLFDVMVGVQAPDAAHAAVVELTVEQLRWLVLTGGPAILADVQREASS